jgi:hypothetical protein
VTPSRRYSIEDTANADSLISTQSNDRSFLESLAFGGLGNVWGLGCQVFSDDELRALGMDANKMAKAYETIVSRIGVTEAGPDVRRYACGDVNGYQRPVELDLAARLTASRYERNRAELNDRGIFLGQMSLATLTEPLGQRRPNLYGDMDFWQDQGRSSYRPRFTLESLRTAKNFNLVSNALVLGFRSLPDSVEVVFCDTTTQSQSTLRCRKLLLAGGALSSARIVGRSLGLYGRPMPFVSNPFRYLACLQVNMLGRRLNEPRLSVPQLALYLDPKAENFNSVFCAIANPKSLMQRAVAANMPVSFPVAYRILCNLFSALQVVTVNHSEYASPLRHVLLAENPDRFTGDELQVHYEHSAQERRLLRATDAQVRRAAISLGLIPLITKELPAGASVHYAGTVPIRPVAHASGWDSSLVSHCTPDGRLTGHPNVFIADASAFSYLPAKGLTLTLMAWSHCVALEAFAN